MRRGVNGAMVDWEGRIVTPPVKQSEENKKLKLRPIGIGMVWPKIISKSILNHYLPHVKDFFEPFQFGLSKSGLESITHICNQTAGTETSASIVESEPGRVINEGYAPFVALH